MGLRSLVLVTGLDGRWRPGIGDPTPLGWITVFAYFATAYLAWLAVAEARRAAAAEGASSDEQERQCLLARFWGLACFVMLVLGINKQLDLQSLLTEVGRELAIAQGWYAERRRYQAMFVLAVFGAGTAGTLALAFAFRRVLRRLVVGLLGLGVIVSFVVIRAASFHHVDALLRGPMGLNWLIELTGIVLVGIAASRGAKASLEAGRY